MNVLPCQSGHVLTTDIRIWVPPQPQPRLLVFVPCYDLSEHDRSVDMIGILRIDKAFFIFNQKGEVTVVSRYMDNGDSSMFPGQVLISRLYRTDFKSVRHSHSRRHFLFRTIGVQAFYCGCIPYTGHIKRRRTVTYHHIGFHQLLSRQSEQPLRCCSNQVRNQLVAFLF